MGTLLSPLFAGGGFGLGSGGRGPQPSFEYNGDVFYINDPVAIDWWCDFMRFWCITTVGFDTEWKPEFRMGENNRIALIQICFRKAFWSCHDSNYVCLLMHVSLSGMTAKLKNFLEDPNVTKAGVVLDQDIHKLSRHYGVDLKSYSDVDTHVQFRIYNCQGPSFGMIKLVDMVLGMDMKKAKSLSMSNWEAIQLSPGQHKYAATDAFACLRLYEALAWQPPPMNYPCMGEDHRMQEYTHPVE